MQLYSSRMPLSFNDFPINGLFSDKTICRKIHFALLYVVVFGRISFRMAAEIAAKLLVVTDDLYLVAGENDGVATWNVQAVRATENAADMRTKRLRSFS